MISPLTLETVRFEVKGDPCLWFSENNGAYWGCDEVILAGKPMVDMSAETRDELMTQVLSVQKKGRIPYIVIRENEGYLALTERHVQISVEAATRN